MNHFYFINKILILEDSFLTLIKNYKEGINIESSKKEVITNFRNTFDESYHRDEFMHKMIFRLHETFKNINYLNYTELTMGARVEVLMNETSGFIDDEKFMLSLIRILIYMNTNTTSKEKFGIKLNNAVHLMGNDIEIDIDSSSPFHWLSPMKIFKIGDDYDGDC